MSTVFDVYRNLHRGCWSIRSTENQRVESHASTYVLDDVAWHVGLGGNARVRREGRKNVHAFARGVPANTSCGSKTNEPTWPEVTKIMYPAPDDRSTTVTYNPYVNTKFQCDGKPVRYSLRVAFFPNGLVTHSPVAGFAWEHPMLDALRERYGNYAIRREWEMGWGVNTALTEVEKMGRIIERGDDGMAEDAAGQCREKRMDFFCETTQKREVVNG